jgi:hypothetical protein
MWKSKTKDDLIIEVWEALDCESVGASEILAIEKEVQSVFGENSLDLPMRVARKLADEGAVLRHSEILEIDSRKRADTPLEVFLDSLFVNQNLGTTLTSLRQLEAARTGIGADDKSVVKKLRDCAIKAKDYAQKLSFDEKQVAQMRLEADESAEWIKLWLDSPPVFENWISLRLNSEEFKRLFPSREEETEEEVF